MSNKSSQLKSISPIDGRYATKTANLQEYFSEYALIKYRVFVEIQYLLAIDGLGLVNFDSYDEGEKTILSDIANNFTEQDAIDIKEIEKTTNHDVKAVEYYIKKKMKGHGIGKNIEMVHFGLTSQDINNTAVPLSIKAYLDNEYFGDLDGLLNTLRDLEKLWEGIPMLARTHGQAASPTTLDKEIHVFTERLNNQLAILKNIQLFAKFGGATGNFNAHLITYPNIDWRFFANEFIGKLGLKRHPTTTQIAHYDDLAQLFNCLTRINVILIDLCRDMWTYISMDYFKQKVIAGEVGSSAMPHKVNPIDFENAEGNLGLANALFHHLSEKLPISRLQRDLTDSTVLRNVGVPFGHTTIAFQSLYKGLNKLILNRIKLEDDLEQNWAVIAEAIQSILRRENYPNPYETLKELTRGKSRIEKQDIWSFIDEIDIPESLKTELKSLSPHTYLGYGLNRDS